MNLPLIILCIVHSIIVHAAKSCNNYIPLSTPRKITYNQTLHLPEIAIPRSPGSQGSAEVRQKIIHHFQDLGWDVTVHHFTPEGRDVLMRNIIVTKGKRALNRITLCCHYDTLTYFQGYHMPNFLGVIDAAVSVDILLQLATDLADHESELQDCKAAANSSVFVHDGTTTQFIFFDGEEPFQDWNPPYDALFGAYALANEWKPKTTKVNGQYTSELDRIKLFVLLDLLGDGARTIPSYFEHIPESHEAWMKLQPLLSSYLIAEQSFSPIQHISDDHEPFLKLGVPILHLIPDDFSYRENGCWHKMCDDMTQVDAEATSEILSALSTFVRGYLD